MNFPHTGKRCSKCRTQFRGTAEKEELCARCAVMGCEVPDDINEQFERLAVEHLGPNFQSLLGISDIFNHKARLSKLEVEIEKGNISKQERIRKKKEIFRLREEIKEREELIESIKSKLLKISLVQNHPKKKSATSTTTTPSTPCYSTPAYSPKHSPPKHSPPKHSPPKHSPVGDKSTPVKWSPVKTTPQPGTSRSSPKSHAKVTFAIRPRKSEEVNNNVPVTASSSSDEEDDKKEKPVRLTRFNSVREKVQAFNALARSHSTGSYDAKKNIVSRNLNKSFNAAFS